MLGGYGEGVEEQPSRTIYKRGLQKKVNRLAGSKFLGVIQTESALESHIMIAAELDPRVVQARPQPFTFDLLTGRTYPSRAALDVEARSGGYKPWIYTPDVLVTLTDGSERLLEGKNSRWLERNPEFADVIAMVRAHRHRIDVVTEDRFTDALVRNLRLLKPLLREPRSQTARETLLSVLTDAPRRIGWLLASAKLRQRDILHALIDGAIHSDLHAHALSPSTEISLGRMGRSSLEILPL